MATKEYVEIIKTLEPYETHTSNEIHALVRKRFSWDGIPQTEKNRTLKWISRLLVQKYKHSDEDELKLNQKAWYGWRLQGALEPGKHITELEHEVFQKELEKNLVDNPEDNAEGILKTDDTDKHREGDHSQYAGIQLDETLLKAFHEYLESEKKTQELVSSKQKQSYFWHSQNQGVVVEVPEALAEKFYDELGDGDDISWTKGHALTHAKQYQKALFNSLEAIEVSLFVPGSERILNQRAEISKIDQERASSLVCETGLTDDGCLVEQVDEDHNSSCEVNEIDVNRAWTQRVMNSIKKVRKIVDTAPVSPASLGTITCIAFAIFCLSYFATEPDKDDLTLGEGLDKQPFQNKLVESPFVKGSEPGTPWRYDIAYRDPDPWL